jgi:hypothetical protein
VVDVAVGSSVARCGGFLPAMCACQPCRARAAGDPDLLGTVRGHRSRRCAYLDLTRAQQGLGINQQSHGRIQTFKEEGLVGLSSFDTCLPNLYVEGIQAIRKPA